MSTPEVLKPPLAGGKIEQKGREWAAALAERMRKGEEGAIALTTKRYLEILRYPLLTEGMVDREDVPKIRVSPFSGALYPDRWDLVRTFITSEGKRSVKNPEQYVFLGGRKILPDLKDLPKEAEIIRLVLPEVWDGIEAAIRQQRHIKERYTLQGELGHVFELMGWAEELSGIFYQQRLTREDLKKFAERTAELIASTGLITAVDKAKRNIARRLPEACNPDILNRVNPLRSRTMIRSTILALTKREIVAELVTHKGTATTKLLVSFREFVRKGLGDGVSVLKELKEKLSPKDPPRTSNERRLLFEFLWGQRRELAEVARAVAEGYLAPAREAPYLLAARQGAILLVGCREEMRDINRKVLGEETMAHILRLPVEELIKNGNFDEAGHEIGWVISPIEQVLSDYESIDQPKEKLLREWVLEVLPFEDKGLSQP